MDSKSNKMGQWISADGATEGLSEIWLDRFIEPQNINNMNLYMEIFYFANVMLTSNRLSFDITDGATHYHHYKVHPQWANKLTKVIRIGDHIFYRNK